MTINGQYYIPKTKKELIEKLIKKWPTWKRAFSSYDKRRLYAIYHSMMKGQLK